MSEGLTFEGESVSLVPSGGVVTLVDGSSFAQSGRSGDMLGGRPHGVFVLDVRHLSRFALGVGGEPVEPLSVAATEPFAATFVGRTRPTAGRADSGVVVIRRRTAGVQFAEEIVLHNYGGSEIATEVIVVLDADFAGLFAVKEGRVASHDGTAEPTPYGVRFTCTRPDTRRATVVTFDPPPEAPWPYARWHVHLPARAAWRLRLDVVVEVDGQPVDASAEPGMSLATWRSAGPAVDTDWTELARAVAQAVEDLGALRIVDPAHPDRTIVAAGAPWFMTPFGRDSLLTAWMSLIVDPGLARGVLETLAELQGTRVDAASEEEPGRILHELRFGQARSLGLGGGQVYYGTVDATPLFVMLLGELRRWGLADDVTRHLLGHADRALEWVEHYGDRDGDGYVEYERMTPDGLLNQGWKDSWDGVPFADGRLAEPPIALCEVQGYVYAAYVARAHFATEAGDDAKAARLREQATALKAAFNRDFWLPDRGWYALALDRDKRPVDALASNMGHCLWTGIVDEDKAPLVAERLLSPEMFSGWGIRTLATSMASYNPVSYHCGSVWPHDNALAVAGLVRYGFVAEAHTVMRGMLDAAATFGGRLPELFSGLARSEVPVPVSYPTSCSPQAWASATPLLFLRSLLRLDPWVPHGKVWLDPALPPGVERLVVERVPLAGQRLRISVRGSSVEVDPEPAGIEIVRTPRQPLAEEIAR
jgi:glycogen debranching enzyme